MDPINEKEEMLLRDALKSAPHPASIKIFEDSVAYSGDFPSLLAKLPNRYHQKTDIDVGVLSVRYATRGGLLHLNPVVVTVTMTTPGTLTLRAVAKSGLINRNTARRCVEKLKTKLTVRYYE